MKTHYLVLPFALFIIATGCDNEPGEGKDRAVVTAPIQKAASTDTETPKVESVTYSFSEAGSQLAFVGAKVTGKHDGGFGKFKGQFVVPGGEITKGEVTVSVDAATLSTDTEKLTGHLKSADFFDVERFPTATFSSTEIKVGGAGEATHTVTGNLQLHGVTKSISFPATISASGTDSAVSAEFVINRKDFAIVYPGKPDDLIKDDVLIKLNIKAKAG